MSAIKDITGKKFGRLTVVRRAPSPNRRAFWECLCDCGATTVCPGVDLRSGHTSSCGCLRVDAARTTGNANARFVPDAVPLTINGGAAVLHVRGGRVLIDAEDWPRVRTRSWMINAAGYVVLSAKPRSMSLHRFILGANGQLADHASRNKLDCRRLNLRPATPAQSAQNRRGWGKWGKGVAFMKKLRKKPWRAYIRPNGRLIHLGFFPTQAAAAEAYKKAAMLHFGEFAAT